LETWIRHGAGGGGPRAPCGWRGETRQRLPHAGRLRSASAAHSFPRRAGDTIGNTISRVNSIRGRAAPAGGEPARRATRQRLHLLTPAPPFITTLTTATRPPHLPVPLLPASCPHPLTYLPFPTRTHHTLDLAGRFRLSLIWSSVRQHASRTPLNFTVSSCYGR